ncbi:uncharacterized protein A4U43_C06F17670 [Asparagus officinalis]|uniref:Carbonic anhydrase n=1 Tax=Asparagus officinalis TaxID=4686 RepID=A0A5P1ENH8_ASPOF|nr:uncharacterized protein A4U43_C06F17670 [Asparagus officinalis]
MGGDQGGVGSVRRRKDAVAGQRRPRPRDHVTALPESGALSRSYHPAPALLKNRGHDIMLKWEDEAGSLWINETQYILKQLHWHSPSEHEVNGRRYPLEMHMVHESDDKKAAVVSSLYTIGRQDPFLARVEDYIAKVGEATGKEEKVGIMDPRETKRGSGKYYRYVGSLTVPPCTEGVVWTIEEKVRTVARKQVELLREAVHDDFKMNARPVQMLNDRIVSMFRPIDVQN